MKCWWSSLNILLLIYDYYVRCTTHVVYVLAESRIMMLTVTKAWLLLIVRRMMIVESRTFVPLWIFAGGGYSFTRWRTNVRGSKSTGEQMSTPCKNHGGTNVRMNECSYAMIAILIAYRSWQCSLPAATARRVPGRGHSSGRVAPSAGSHRWTCRLEPVRAGMTDLQYQRGMLLLFTK